MISAGLVLGTLSLAAALYAVITTGTNTTAAIVAGVAAVLAITGLVRVERRVAGPLVPPSMFRRRAFAVERHAG